MCVDKEQNQQTLSKHCQRQNKSRLLISFLELSSVSIELLSSSARVKTVKSTKVSEPLKCSLMGVLRVCSGCAQSCPELQ